MKTGIYKIINLTNGKIYIGSAIDFRRRELEHYRGLRLNIHHSIALQRAYNKYGKENFVFEKIEYCEIENLIEREQFYIDTLLPDYNTSKTAGSTLGVKKTEEQRAAQSLRQKGKKNHTPQQIEAIRKAHTGKIVSKETREKRSRRVIQKDLSNKEIARFYSLTEAIRVTGCNNLVNVLRGNQQTSGGFRWEYENETQEDRDLVINKSQIKTTNILQGRIKAGVKMRKSVLQLDLNNDSIIKEFDSIRNAEIAMCGEIKGNISNCIRNRQKTAYGFKWKMK